MKLRQAIKVAGNRWRYRRRPQTELAADSRLARMYRDTDLLRSVVEVPTEAWLWGQRSIITPHVCDKVFGDGRQLIGLAPLDTRPNYYVVRIDSRWGLDNYSEPAFCDEGLDAVYDSLEEQFGHASFECEECGHDYDCFGEGCQCCEDERWFPVPRFDSGSSWWGMDWPCPKRRATVTGRRRT